MLRVDARVVAEHEFLIVQHHARVVGGLEPRCRDDGSDARLFEHVLQLVHAIRRVDVDEHGPDLGGRILRQPLVGTFVWLGLDPNTGETTDVPELVVSLAEGLMPR